ncbi:MAG: ComEA family DNA-binding protein, partial [Oscillospiraceae bacterium]|nr:ComEA family DNA-binding protein [Oscillospiraceae bacterium]
GNSVNVSDELKLNPAATASRSLTVNSSPVAPDNEGAKPININVADEQELASLPGIGEVIAGRIVEYRTLYGNFQVPSDIMDVAGIGPPTYEKIKDLIITEENS